jgi:hypothetical protein
MARQYKLRLGDGTLLAVDLVGLRAWLHDHDARVQRVGSRRWRTLKDMIEAETLAAAAKEAAPRPEPPPPPPPRREESAPAPVESVAKPGANVPILPPDAFSEPAPIAVAAAAPAEEIQIPVEQEIAIPIDQEVIIPAEPEIAKPAPPPVLIAPPPKTPVPPPPKAPIAGPAKTPASQAARAPFPASPKTVPPPPVVDLGEVARVAATTAPAARPMRAAVAATSAAAVPSPKPARPPLAPIPEDVEVVPLAAIDLGDVARSAVTSPFVGFTPPRATRPPAPSDALPLIPLKPLEDEDEEDVLEELDLVEEERPPSTLPALPALPALPPIAKTLLDTASAWVARITAPRPPRPEPAQPPPPLSELPSIPFAPLDEARRRLPALPTRKILIGAAAIAGLAAAWTAVGWLSSLDLFTRKAPPPAAAGVSAPAPQETAPALPPELQAAVEQLPHLDAETIRLVASTVQPGPADPPDVFRRAQLAANRGVSALAPDEAQELRALRSAVVGALRPVDRERVLAYDRVTAGRDLLVGEDARVARLYARGVHALPAPRRERLQALLGKAIAAALGRSGPRADAPNRVEQGR